MPLPGPLCRYPCSTRRIFEGRSTSSNESGPSRRTATRSADRTRPPSARPGTIFSSKRVLVPQVAFASPEADVADDPRVVVGIVEQRQVKTTMSDTSVSWAARRQLFSRSSDETVVLADPLTGGQGAGRRATNPRWVAMISNEQQSVTAEIVAKHRALVVLRILIDDELRGAANEAVLSDLLDVHGLGCTRAGLRSCLRFLEQSGLIATAVVDELAVARITNEGAEVAHGRATAENVLPFTASCLY